ncbi:aminopeptidase P family protein [Nonomuraea sp. NN258]|uniref:M24 family metallopeptidase n=1 Tax=Nonomuraea antri TaxID=2730852 RepID=UPI001568DFC4|nr:Xaa-Pro peptidase family protein [Nonomuraea antri]NRQ35298.1 aminopeptidase P family protein [Nonomuraea antri]
MREEYERRQDELRRLAAGAGLRGVLAWSRGGSTHDHYADVYYLTGFYQHQPAVPDEPGRWQAQGHAALLLPVDGPALLLTGDGESQDPQPAAARLNTPFPVDALGEQIRLTLPPGRVGVLGCAAMGAPWWCRLRSVLPGHELVGADDLGHRMRRIKSPAEQDLLRAAGTLGARAMRAALDAAVPGATEAESAAAAVAEIVRGGGAYYGMGVSSGAASHTFAASGPAPYSAERRLAVGDLFRMDLYGSLGGYLFDLARTTVVGTEPTAEQRALLDAVRDSVLAGVEILRPGRRFGEVARRCQEVFDRSAFVARHGRPDSQLGGAWGHGLGLSFEPPWIAEDGAYADERVEAGMCVALERRIALPMVGGANYEDDILVTDTGPEIITPS